MRSNSRSVMQRLLWRKDIMQDNRIGDGASLVRSLGPMNLVFLGVGCIIGAGVYIMTDVAAANYAGTAVVLSFALAGIACSFAALCYAELAAALPFSESAYSYAYAVLGEVFAWMMGWLLLLEYGVSAAGVAVGWSASVTSLLADFNRALPVTLTTPLLQSNWTTRGLEFNSGHGANILAAAGILAIAGWLLLGIRRRHHSMR